MPSPHIFGQDQQFGPPIVRYQNTYNEYVDTLREYGYVGNDLINTVATYIGQGDNRRVQTVRRNIYMGLTAAGVNTVSVTYTVLSKTLQWVANAIAYRSNEEHEDMQAGVKFVEATIDKQGTFCN
jgi:hypothetical protein